LFDPGLSREMDIDRDVIGWLQAQKLKVQKDLVDYYVKFELLYDQKYSALI
jgi:hypothetical protein